MNHLFIVGTGGFAKEVYSWCGGPSNPNIVAFLDDNYGEETFEGLPVVPMERYKPGLGDVVIAVGNPQTRKKIVEKELPKDTKYATIVHPSVVMGQGVEIGQGSVLCPNTVITTNIKIGNHSHLNLNSTVGHDCILNDYFTAAPLVAISGNVTTEECVYFGTSSSIIEKKSICKNVIIGANSCVTSNITKPGTYVGTPAKKIK